MTLDQIKELIEFIREHDLSEFELEQDGVKLRIKSGPAVAPPPVHYPVAPLAHPPAYPSSPAAPPSPATAPASAAQHPSDEEGPELAIVKSPIVGTFYRSPEPGAPPFADVGSTVSKGQVLCIIEAMKLMNEIDSEYDGEIVSAYVENGQAVQYGERLFAIRLKS
jgi:acetyl-CoA carboxylase biotin carboxyl carrier protein